jgi:ubiquinone/menaquinone biosynthesis C-methylase UbiE
MAAMSNGNHATLKVTRERLLTDEYNVYTLEHLHRYGIALSLCKGKRVLDIASGEGYGSNLLAGVAESVVGVDISEQAISHARAKYVRRNLRYQLGAAESIPLESDSIDVVVSFETIEHHDKHKEMLSEIKRVLRAEGVLIMSTPDKLYYTDVAKETNHFHVKELYLEEFRSLVEQYFVNVGIMRQKISFGSLITPEKDAKGFVKYEGTYSEIRTSSTIEQQLYNICIASDAALPTLGVSFFEGLRVLQDGITERERMLVNSTSFRIGRTITWPIRKLKSLTRAI